MEGVDRGFLEDSGGQPPLQQLVNLHHSPEGIVLVELFAGLSTGLAAVLEAGLSVSTYVYVDNTDMVSKAAKHHIKQLQARYPRQLPASAVQGCMSQLPGDISLIGEEDLQRLGRVDLVMERWPCQGHSRAGLEKGLQDPRSGLFWELLRLLRWWQRMQAHTRWIHFGECTTTWDSGSTGSGKCTACVSLPGKTSGSGCSSPGVLCCRDPPPCPSLISTFTCVYERLASLTGGVHDDG